jgi:hypothetical protein
MVNKLYCLLTNTINVTHSKQLWRTPTWTSQLTDSRREICVSRSAPFVIASSCASAVRCSPLNASGPVIVGSKHADQIQAVVFDPAARGLRPGPVPSSIVNVVKMNI